MAINKERITLNPKKRFEILRRDNFTCQYCGRKPPEVVLEVDHAIPVAKGGPNDDINLRAACKRCNIGKGTTLLVDGESIQQSRDLLEMSRAELELLGNTVKWCQELADARRKQKEIITANLESIAGRAFDEEERKGAYKAFKKYGFEVCADHVDDYLDERVRREERGMNQYDLLQYINFQNLRHTVDGRLRYLMGIVRRTVLSGELIGQTSRWIRRTEFRAEFVEELIESLKKLCPLSDHKLLEGTDFLEWWHEHVREEYGACCQYHTPGPEERIIVPKVQLDASIELEYPIHNRQIRKDYPRAIKGHTCLPEPEDEPYLSEDIAIRVRRRNQPMPPRLVIVRE